MNKNTLIWIRAILATICPASIGVGTALIIHKEVLFGYIMYLISIVTFIITLKLDKKIYGK